MKITGHVYRRKDTGSFGAYLRLNGKAIRQQSGFETKSAAREGLAEWERALRSTGTLPSREQERETLATLLPRKREELIREEMKSPDSFDADAKTLVEGPRSGRTKGSKRSGGLGELPLVALTPDVVDDFRDRCVAAGLSKKTVDNAITTLSAALAFAVSKGLLARAPEFSLFNPDNRRTGFFEPEEHERVIANLPGLIADVASFAYGSGWRRAEIVELSWDRVDRKNGIIRLDDSKNGDRRTLPYGKLAGLSALIERRWAARTYETKNGPAISSLVFHDRGREVGDFRKVWYSACVKAGVGRWEVDPANPKKRAYVGKLFHDYRRSAVRDLIRAGVDRVVAKLITGHRSDSVFERYAIMVEDDKAAGLAKLEQLRAGTKSEPSKVSSIFNGSSTQAGNERN